jgi:hypothetical protein
VDVSKRKESRTSKGIVFEAEGDVSVDNEQYFKEEEEELREDDILMQAEIEFIGKMSDAELNEPELAEDLERDLMRLLDEAERPAGDERSRRICEKLEGWMKKGLGKALRKYKRRRTNMGKFSEN